MSALNFRGDYHAGRVDRQRVFKVLHAAKVLPVWILYPAGKHIFIAQVKRVFEIVQSNHQSCADGGPTSVGAKG